MTAAPLADPPASPSWIAKLLRLERDGDDFTPARPERSSSGSRLFGGLIAAQALAAACATLPDAAKLPQSLHLYFVRGGQPDVDVVYTVERTRDGRSFDTRRTTAVQGDAVILEMLASFHQPEPGVDTHPTAPPIAGVDECPIVDMPPEMSARFELRAPGRKRHMFAGPPHWIRTRDAIEDDPVVRACLLTYLSDMGLMAAARPPETPLVFGAGVAASLDHSVWFHRPFDPARWHCYQASSLNNNDSRGLAIGALYDEDGTLIASMTQEALWRV
jgi:acyl-CoA thioesterase